ncbi:MAG: hypothetical protein K2J08_04855 [Ruminococcus sp.]|nr:hypothetical protein [Ruminococcus sp.]
MSQIKYNEKEEAYEITYKLWENPITVRFYVEEEKEIMDNFSEIAQKLDKLNRNRKKIAEIIADNGYYGGAVETLSENMQITKAYVDIDEDGVVVCFTVDSLDGYLRPLAMELSTDNGIETVGYDTI